jgi:hypothetical protein
MLSGFSGIVNGAPGDQNENRSLKPSRHTSPKRQRGDIPALALGACVDKSS